MAEHKPVYLYSLTEALRNNERDLWRESYQTKATERLNTPTKRKYRTVF